MNQRNKNEGRYMKFMSIHVVLRGQERSPCQSSMEYKCSKIRSGYNLSEGRRETLLREKFEIFHRKQRYTDDCDLNKNENPKLKIHPRNFAGLRQVEVRPERILKTATSQVLAFKALILRVKREQDEFEKPCLKACELNPGGNLTLLPVTNVLYKRL